MLSRKRTGHPRASHDMIVYIFGGIAWTGASVLKPRLGSHRKRTSDYIVGNFN